MTNIKFAPKDNTDNKIIHLYSDGGCRATAKKGETIKETDKCAYAFFLRQGGHEKLDGWAGYGKTNNAMEIAGLLNGLKAIKNKNVPVIAYLDSAYVVNTIEKQWYVKWERDGWTKKGGLKNAELWKELINLIREFPFFRIEKVKGHSDDEFNNLVDKHLNELMDNLPDVPSVPIEKPTMMEQVIKDNVPPIQDNQFFLQKRDLKSSSPVIEVKAQRAFSNTQMKIMLPEVLSKMVEVDLSEALAKEIIPYMEIKENNFGDNKIFSTSLKIVNDKATQRFVDSENSDYIKTSLKMLSMQPDFPNQYKTILEEILRRL